METIRSKAYPRTGVLPLFFVLLAAGIVGGFAWLSLALQPVPAAKQGVLDLSAWSWEANGTLPLKGDWAFYWNELRDPADFKPDQEGPGAVFVHSPGSWNGTVVRGEVLGGLGYATYRLRVILPETRQPLALRMPAVSTAYKLWVNGKEAVAAGVVGVTVETSEPEYLPKIATLHPQGNEMDLVLQISNFDHQKGGLRNPIELGPFESVFNAKELSVGFDSLLIGSLLIMGLYHLGLFAVRTKELSMLFFGLFCLIYSVRISLLGEMMLIKVMPWFNWKLQLLLEYLTASLGLPLFLLFFSYLYPKESSRRAVTAIGVLMVSYSLVIAVMPSVLFTQGLWMLQTLLIAGITYIMYMSALAIVRRREGSLILLMSCSLFTVTIINDMLYAHEWIGTTDRLSAFGLFIFIFSQSVVMSIKFSRAYGNEERLSARLSQRNSGLLHKVMERTGDLQRANEALRRSNEYLSRMEQSRSHLLSNISHDLGTPLTTIQCYVEAILDGLVDTEDQQEHYLRLIHDKVLGMDRLIGDLFQLSRLEARQADFHMEPVRSADLFGRLFERYVLDASNAGVAYTLEIMGNAALPERGSVVRADLERMHQAYGNLIYNAFKFTPAGGQVQVKLKDDGSRIVCSIRDTGIGIKPEDLPFVFDRFYTSNESRNVATGGKGLGLSICREIVEYHGGRLWVEWTSLGDGTEICFELPAENV